MELAFASTFDMSGYGGKLFWTDPIKLDSRWEIPGVGASTPEGKEVEKQVRSLWLKEMDAFKKAKEKEYKEILAYTDRALHATAKKKGEEWLAKGDSKSARDKILLWLDEEAKGANRMIANALTTFRGIAERKMGELWTKIAATVDKKFKSGLSKAKIRAALQIGGLAILIVGTAALTIAATVIGTLNAPTGQRTSTGLGIAMKGMSSIANAASKIRNLYASNWPTHKTSAQTLVKKATALKEAIEYEEKKLAKSSQGAKLGPKEKGKLFLLNTGNKRKELAVSLKMVSVSSMSMLQDVERSAKAEVDLEKRLETLEKQLATEQDKKKAADLQKLFDTATKKMFDLRVARESTRGYLRRTVAVMNEGNALLDSEDKLTAAALGQFLGKVMVLNSSTDMSDLIAIGDSSADVIARLVKATA